MVKIIHCSISQCLKNSYTTAKRYATHNNLQEYKNKGKLNHLCNNINGTGNRLCYERFLDLSVFLVLFF